MQQPEAPVKKGSGITRIIRRSLITLIVLAILLPSTAALLVWIYEDEIKGLAIKQLEKHLNTELIIDTRNIDLSVIKDFPYASLDFKEVKALDAVIAQKKDTLFKAGSIGFRFNIIDFFKKNYRIKRIHIADAQVKVWIDKSGKDNYHFLKESKDTADAGVAFELEKLTASNISVTFLDHRNKSDHAFTINKAGLSGNFSSESYMLESTSDLYIHHLRTDSISWVRNNNFSLDAELLVNNTTGTYSIKRSEAKLSDLLLDISGEVQAREKDTRLDLAVKGKDLDIQSMLSLLPGQYREKVKEYESSGIMYLHATVKGTASASSSPVVTAAFGIDKGEITQTGSNVTLKNVNLKGEFVNGHAKDDKNYLDIERFSCNVAEGHVDGMFGITNFDDPTINASANANIDLGDLQKFLAIDTIESVSGDLKLNASFKGKVKDAKEYLASDFENTTTTGQMTVKDATLRLKNNNLRFDSLGALFRFSNNDIEINNFSGSVSGNDFNMRGYFRNVLSWIFLEGQDLTVDAAFRSRSMNLEAFLADKSGASPKADDYKMQLSPHINFNLESEIGTLKFKRFEARNIRGSLKLKDKLLYADPVVMETMGGTVKLDGMIDGTKDDKLLVTCNANVKEVNISKLFYQLDNFGQAHLTDQHLKGTANGDITFASVCAPDLTIDPAKIFARSSIRIDKGELIGFKPLKELTAYIKKDITLFFLKVDELEKKLDHIKFATLENTIEVRDQVITIPDMVIKSSAMDIGFSGTHAFSGDINYHFAFVIRELLIRSERENERRNTEFGLIEDDGHYHFPLHLVMTGTTGKYQVKRDKQSIKEKRREDLKKEKENLKTILREEFGWFRKDSASTAGDKKQSDKLNVSFDERPAARDDKGQKKKKKEEDLLGDDF